MVLVLTLSNSTAESCPDHLQLTTAGSELTEGSDTFAISFSACPLLLWWCGSLELEPTRREDTSHPVWSYHLMLSNIGQLLKPLV